jgi:hypothetical protein
LYASDKEAECKFFQLEHLIFFGFAQVYYASNQNINTNILPQENKTPSDMQMYIHRRILDNTVAEATPFSLTTTTTMHPCRIGFSNYQMHSPSRHGSTTSPSLSSHGTTPHALIHNV